MKIIYVVIMVVFSLVQLNADAHLSTACVSHRGLNLVNHITVEHSLKSFHGVVLKSGARHVEFDVRHTVDHIPLVVHDQTLLRTAISKKNRQCPLEKKISDLTYFQIKDHCELKDGSQIPTMDEVLFFFSLHKVHAFVELKDEPGYSTATILNRYLKKSTATIISFEEEYLKQIKKIIRLNGFALSHLEYLPIKKTDTAKDNSFSGIDLSIASQDVVNKWHDLGKKIGVWTINDPVQIKQYILKGVDYITTDQFSKCLKLVTTFN